MGSFQSPPTAFRERPYLSKWMLRAVAAVGLVTAVVLTACSDSAERRSLTGPTALAPGGALRVEAEAGLTQEAAQAQGGPPQGLPPGSPEEIAAVRGETLKFDDITSASTETIPNLYGGLNWTHFGVVDPIAYGESVTGACGPEGHVANGYVNGTVSPKYVAYSPLGGPAEVTATARTFDFISAYFTAANDKQMEVFGYNNGTLLYTRIFEINCDSPTLLEANFFGVDRVVFDSRFGSGGYSPLGDTFAMDNFTYNKNLPARPVP